MLTMIKLISESPREPEGSPGGLNSLGSPSRETSTAVRVAESTAAQQLIYFAAVPTYEPIFGAAVKAGGVKTNLMSHFVCMSPFPEAFGNVLTRSDIALRF